MSDAFPGRARPGEYAPYYERYVARVPEGDIRRLLAEQWEEAEAFLRSIPPERADFRYAEGKWSIKEVVAHVADTERVMSYRLLRVGRGDATPLASFDENAYAAASGAAARSLDDLVDELAAVRRATIALAAGLPDEAWTRTGTASDLSVSARGVAYIIAGHELHHRALLAERYLGVAAEAE